MRHSKTVWLVAVLALAVVASGCATKKYTRDYVAGETQVIHERVDDVEEQVEQNQTRIEAHDQEIEQAQQDAMEASKTAKEALDRAQEAGKLAEGKLLYEEVMTDNDVQFGFDKASLSDDAKAALDDFAQNLKQEYDTGIYIEVQGHTDNIGTEAYNETLGLERAEAVHRYLNREHDIPLHRMNVISYGESEPIADNSTREGRAQNRRVALVVLK